MKSIVLIFLSMITTSCATTQDLIEVKAMCVYNYFQQKGYTTATAFTQFNDFENQNVKKIKANPNDCKYFYDILRDIKPRKHFQTKLGIYNVFIELSTQKSKIRMVVCSDRLLLDLTNRKEYWLSSEEQKKWIEDFINRIKNTDKHY